MYCNWCTIYEKGGTDDRPPAQCSILLSIVYTCIYIYIYFCKCNTLIYKFNYLDNKNLLKSIFSSIGPSLMQTLQKCLQINCISTQYRYIMPLLGNDHITWLVTPLLVTKTHISVLSTYSNSCASFPNMSSDQLYLIPLQRYALIS